MWFSVVEGKVKKKLKQKSTPEGGLFSKKTGNRCLSGKRFNVWQNTVSRRKFTCYTPKNDVAMLSIR